MNSFMSQSASADSYHLGGGGTSAMSPSFNNGNSNGIEHRLTIGKSIFLCQG